MTGVASGASSITTPAASHRQAYFSSSRLRRTRLTIVSSTSRLAVVISILVASGMVSSISAHAALGQRDEHRKEHFIYVIQRRYRAVHRLTSKTWPYRHWHFADSKSCEVEPDEHVCIRVISRVIVS